MRPLWASLGPLASGVRVQWPWASCSVTTNGRCWGTRPPVQHLLTSTAGCWGSKWREWPALHLYEPHLENGSKGAPGSGGAAMRVLPSALHLGLPSSGAGVCPLPPSVFASSRSLRLPWHVSLCVCVSLSHSLARVSLSLCVCVCVCVSHSLAACVCLCFSFFSTCISFCVCVCVSLSGFLCVCVFWCGRVFLCVCV